MTQTAFVLSLFGFAVLVSLPWAVPAIRAMRSAAHAHDLSRVTTGHNNTIVGTPEYIAEQVKKSAERQR